MTETLAPAAHRTIAVEIEGEIATVALARPDKRNALNDAIIGELDGFFRTLPSAIRAVILHAQGAHFSAGLDLNELTSRTTIEAVAHSRTWHRVLEQIEFGRVPVIAVMHGAVVGGGLEVASACHVRVAERSAFFALPEASRGIFVGGGGAVRISRLIGESRMMEMMMTGRTYDADEGQRLGLSHYLVDDGGGLEKARQLARRIAGNTAMTNYALMHALPRIARADDGAGYMLEALMSAIASGDPEAQARLVAFLDKRGPKVTRS